MPITDHPAERSPYPRSRALELAAELQKNVRGEVRFDEGSRALYATDLSMYRQVPIGVVIPRDIDDVVQTVALARRYEAPILARGCGTSLAGQCCNVAVVIDFSKYLNRIVDLDPATRTAWVEPGVICEDLRVAAERHHLTFGPDPATREYCTMGGMIGNNSCGAHSIMGGTTADNVEELDILTYDGLRMRIGKYDGPEVERLIRDDVERGPILGQLKALGERYSAEIRARYPDIPRRISGYNLDALLPGSGLDVARSLVGTEGTCVTILGARVRLIPSPPFRALAVIGYPDYAVAADQVPRIMEHGPTALEGFQNRLVENMALRGKPLSGARLLPDGAAWLLVEFGGSTLQEASDRARQLIDELARIDTHQVGMKLFDARAQQLEIWQVPKSGVGASRVPGVEEAWPGWEDSAVAPEKLGVYLRDLRQLLTRYEYSYTLYGHFGHGCVHVRITFDPKTPDGVRRFRSFMNEAADLVVSYGGSLSGEHGDGQARGELLPKMFGGELMQAFREFKSIWDPSWKMNPGKVIDANPLDQNLRTGPDYRPRPVKTHFKFPEDGGSFAAATERCFGVGKCRGLDGGTMCPSFMVTREEMHTTRGRAHLLFEALRGDVLKDLWNDERVKESLHLCLACKGCKSDCPVSVDLATYKAEFLSHYYARKLRPRSAYAFGLIFYWARLAAFMPGMANFFTRTPLLRDIAKYVVGMPPERQIPAFAPRTFKDWFRQRARRVRQNEPAATLMGRPSNTPGDTPADMSTDTPIETPTGAPADRSKVILWADTFNNHFHTETARAALEVLERAGFQVEVPLQHLCCGRPLYDHGMLDLAKRLLRQVLDVLEPQILAGVPLVGLEPSCVAVFRDELVNLFPDDERARRLSQQSFLLGEFLEKKAPDFQIPALHRKALVHGHCHQKAVMGMADEAAVLSRAGVDHTVLDSGCCGMAGSFGFEKGDRYEVSIKAGERVLLPAVRDAAKETIIIADGFSCREQIAQTTDRQALHLAEVLHMALQLGDKAPAADYPEAAYSQPGARPPTVRAVAITAAALLSSAILLLYKIRVYRSARR